MSAETGVMYVLFAREHDGSSHEVLRVYESNTDAEDALQLVRAVGSSQKVEVLKVPFYSTHEEIKS